MLDFQLIEVFVVVVYFSSPTQSYGFKIDVKVTQIILIYEMTY